MGILLRRKSFMASPIKKFFLFDASKPYTYKSLGSNTWSLTQTNDEGFTMSYTIANKYTANGVYGAHSWGADDYGAYLGIDTVWQSGQGEGAYIWSTNALDFVGYSKLCFQASIKNINGIFYRGVISTPNMSSVLSAESQITNATDNPINNTVIKVDVRNVTDKPYIALCAKGTSGGHAVATAKIYKIWLQ